MSKTVRIVDGTVREIIPPAATIPSVAFWYGAEFAAQCIEAPDEVMQNWTYDVEAETFAAPVPPEPTPSVPTIEEQITSVQNHVDMIDNAISDFFINVVPTLGTGV
ncbi:hypothetical protein SAMN02745823_02545 [Sporobacter termitidis DSM 10068]|uniref:Uncharacterized protein n=1 Tax=Sporobacter termitidis DSM 10068 TaxID=1123282 RepID=A0A1M5YIW8_9FIRM|nr:hypothetical protein [Sporobacter termitidis]SHI11483.1 hypothetical protein SAMN02745823_02545 [Sporobacter termitidis DSM 10068]